MLCYLLSMKNSRKSFDEPRTWIYFVPFNLRKQHRVGSEFTTEETENLRRVTPPDPSLRPRPSSHPGWSSDHYYSVISVICFLGLSGKDYH